MFLSNDSNSRPKSEPLNFDWTALEVAALDASTQQVPWI